MSSVNAVICAPGNRFAFARFATQKMLGRFSDGPTALPGKTLQQEELLRRPSACKLGCDKLVAPGKTGTSAQVGSPWLVWWCVCVLHRPRKVNA